MVWEALTKALDSKEKGPNFWASVELNQNDKTMSLIDCPYCNRRLQVPEKYSGRLTCPSCRNWCQRQNGTLFNQSGEEIIYQGNDEQKTLLESFLNTVMFQLGAYIAIAVLFLSLGIM